MGIVQALRLRYVWPEGVGFMGALRCAGLLLIRAHITKRSSTTISVSFVHFHHDVPPAALCDANTGCSFKDGSEPVVKESRLHSHLR